MSTTQDKKHSSAVYAAAGIGDLAYEQLKKIPALAEELRVKAGTLREQGPTWRSQATDKAAQLAGKVDVEKIRTVLVNNAHKAAEKASSVFEDLVARGERVVDQEAPATASKAADKVADGAAIVFDEAVKVSEQTAKAAETAAAETAAPKPATPRRPKATGTGTGTATGTGTGTIK